jgi:hypothetical protein
MSNFWWLVLPSIVDDDECELCDDLAMPYEALTEYPWCPMHAMQMWCGLGMEDYAIDALKEAWWETKRADNKIPRTYDTLCTDSYYGDICLEEATPRLKKRLMDAPEITKACANLCIEHAHKHFGVDDFLDMETWLMECGIGYRASLDMEEE